MSHAATASRPQRWAVVAAWVAFLATVPPVLWRILMLLGVAPYALRDTYVSSPGAVAYVLGLDLLQVAAGFCSLALIQSWGERWPRWVPGLAGREIPTMLVVVVASLGALAVLVITGALAVVFGTRLLGFAEGPTPLDGTTGWGFWLWLVLYLPWLAWGPALVVAIVGYWRRRVR